MLISVRTQADTAPACLSIIHINCVQFPFLIPLVASPLCATFCPQGWAIDLCCWFWLRFCGFSEPGWKQSSSHTGSHLCSCNPSLFALNSAECVSFSLSLGTLKSLPQSSTAFVLPTIAASLPHPVLPFSILVLHLGWSNPNTTTQRGLGCSPPIRLWRKVLRLLKVSKLNASQQLVNAARSQPNAGLYKQE